MPKVEALRGFIYDKATIEVGRVIDVDDQFAHWAARVGKVKILSGGKSVGPGVHGLEPATETPKRGGK